MTQAGGAACSALGEIARIAAGVVFGVGAMTKIFMVLAAAGTLAVSAPFSIAWAEESSDEGASKYSEVQKLGYLGRTSKSALTRSVLERLKSRRYRANDTFERLVMWHNVALDSVALDHTPDPDTGAVPFVQGGPTRTSRGLAMTQIAVYDALNAFSHDYAPYNDIGRAQRLASEDVAIAWAAYTVQKTLYPEQRDRLTEILVDDLRDIRAGLVARHYGREIGIKSAFAILKNRKNDGSRDAEPQFGDGGRVASGTTNYFGEAVNAASTNIGEWTPDPNTPEFSGALTTNYSHPLNLIGKDGDIALITQLSYKSRTHIFEIPNPLLDQGGYGLLDASLVWTAEDGRPRRRRGAFPPREGLRERPGQ